jgi:putative hydroxymethylpyrimidine transport system substrate-binding protein
LKKGRKHFFFEKKKQKTFVNAVFASFILFTAPSAQARDKISVILDWFVNPDHAPILVAQQIGAYAAEDLDVTLIPPADPTMGPKLVAAGQADVALTAEPQFLEAASSGLDLVRFGVLIDRPLSTLVTLKGSGISTLADLRGKRIGYGSGETERAMVAAMLRTAGLTLTDVHMVQIGEQLTVALLAKQVDAVTVYRNFETLELAEHGATPLGFDYETHGVPTFDELIYVARANAAHDPRLVRFLRATAKGAAMLRAHPEASWKRFAADHPDLDDTLNHAAWYATLSSFASNPFELDAAAYARFDQFLLSAGAVSKLTPSATVRLSN